MNLVRYIEHSFLNVLGEKVLYFELETGDKHTISQWRPSGPPEAQVWDRKCIFPPHALKDSRQFDAGIPKYRADTVRQLAESVIKAYRVTGFDNIPAGAHPGYAFVYQLHRPSGDFWGSGCTDIDPGTLLIVDLPSAKTSNLKEALEQAWKYAIPLKEIIPQELLDDSEDHS